VVAKEQLQAMHDNLGRVPQLRQSMGWRGAKPKRYGGTHATIVVVIIVVIVAIISILNAGWLFRL